MNISLYYVVIVSLVCFGVHASTRPGKLLGPVVMPIEIALMKLRCHWITLPLWNCIACMSSVWSCIYIMAFDMGFDLYDFYGILPAPTKEALFFILCVCGLNAVAVKILKGISTPLELFRPERNQN